MLSIDNSVLHLHHMQVYAHVGEEHVSYLKKIIICRKTSISPCCSYFYDKHNQIQYIKFIHCTFLTV